MSYIEKIGVYTIMHEYSKRGCDFMLRNKKGSTLATVLIVFSVLMIFGVFILSFMVNENKMAINHQKKTQAYYVARSGAVAVEAAILEMDIVNDIPSFEALLLGGKDIKVKEIDFTGVVGTPAKANVTISPYGNDILVTSTGIINGVEETVKKVVMNNINTPIIAISKLSKNLVDLKDVTVARLATKDEENQFKTIADNIDSSSISWEGGSGTGYTTLPSVTDGTLTLGTDGGVTNYVYDKRLMILEKNKEPSIIYGAKQSELNIDIKGEVNLFIKGGIKISEGVDVKINVENSPGTLAKEGEKGYPGNLNIYVIDGEAPVDPLIDIGISNNSLIRANILTNTALGINIYTQASKYNPKVFFAGSIYAPYSKLTFGGGQNMALTFKGTIVADEVDLVGKEVLSHNEKFVEMLYKDNAKETLPYLPGHFMD